MVIPNPWYTGNNTKQETIQASPWIIGSVQIIEKLIKRLDEEKKLSNNGMEKQSNCSPSYFPPTFHRIQDTLHSPTEFLQNLFAIIQSTCYRLIKGQQYLKKCIK